VTYTEHLGEDFHLAEGQPRSGKRATIPIPLIARPSDRKRSGRSGRKEGLLGVRSRSMSIEVNSAIHTCR
jgi:hypothetical protein